jgi:hypothetical protein
MANIPAHADMPKPTKEVIGQLGIAAEDVRDIGLGVLEASGRLLRALREDFRVNTERVKRRISWEDRISETVPRGYEAGKAGSRGPCERLAPRIPVCYTEIGRNER